MSSKVTTKSTQVKSFAMKQVGKVGWIETEVEECGDYDALLKPIAVSPCTSDIHTVYSGAIGERRNLVLGHEAIGEVIEVGEKVEDFKPGDKVIVPAITPDWNSLDIQDKSHQHTGGMLSGFRFANLKNGVFSECFHVNHADLNLAHLHKEISTESALMLTDMVTTGLHGSELAKIGLGDTVAVIGIGPVGLMAVAGAKLRGASRIFGVGSREICVNLAKEYGMTDHINYKNGDIGDQIMAATKEKGVDATIVAGGHSDILKNAVKITKPTGTIANLVYFDEDDEIPLPRLDWGNGMAHKDIRGGLCPGGRIRMEKLRDLVLYNRLDPGKLISHRFYGFNEIETAFKLMKNKPRDLVKPIVMLN